MSKSKFAKNQLTKHGWKEGAGLGRQEAGMKEAIKVKIKTDTAGIGHNQGDEFTFHWWDHVFNKAAGSISVENSENGVALKKTLSNGPISNKKTKSYDNKAMLYGKFVKAATLSDGNYQPQNDKEEESEDSEDEGDKVRNRVVSNEMLEMCDGMTAHKAARHGHKCNGKLIRVQEQEKNLLEQMKKSLKKDFVSKEKKKDTAKINDEDSVESEKNIQNEKAKKRKNKKDKKSKDSETESESVVLNENDISSQILEEVDCDSSLSGKKKRKRKFQEENENDIRYETTEKIECDSQVAEGKKKKRKQLHKNENNDSISHENCMTKNVNEKKKLETEEKLLCTNNFNTDNTEIRRKKKKKKNKSKRHD